MAIKGRILLARVVLMLQCIIQPSNDLLGQISDA